MNGAVVQRQNNYFNRSIRFSSQIKRYGLSRANVYAPIHAFTGRIFYVDYIIQN